MLNTDYHYKRKTSKRSRKKFVEFYTGSTLGIRRGSTDLPNAITPRLD
jgi:hypothetical protein